MCPTCMASAALMIGGVMSATGLTAVLMKKFGAKNGAKESVQKPNQKEETWAR